MLVKAQVISSENNLGYFIYADSEINPKLKSKFFVLSMNKMDLKIHLKTVDPEKAPVDDPISTSMPHQSRIDISAKKTFLTL